MKIECFTIEESPYNPGRWMIQPIHENFLLKSTKGSYNIICARLLNLSYAQYLRFCRDIVGAEIIGKNTTYPVPYFKRDNRLSALVRLLNTRANLVLWEREHPDWQQHQDKVVLWKEVHNVFNA